MYRETAAEGFPEPKVVELGLKVRFIFPLIKPLILKLDKGVESGVESYRKTPMDESVLALLRECVEYTIPDKPNSRLQKYRIKKKRK
jgi:hypothetical protein